MSEIDHELCRYLLRDQEVRAAEDAAAVPSIQHRDLPEQVALLWASVGDLIGRVVRLEGEIDAGQDEEADAARDEAVAHGATLSALAEARQSLAAANRGIARLTAERDAARAESDRLRAAGDAMAEALTWDQSCAYDAATTRGAIRQRIAAWSEARACVAELEGAAKLAPDRNAGGGSNHPVAWLHEELGSCFLYPNDELKSKCVPLYAAPQPPRGWLTAEEREASTEAMKCMTKLRRERDEANAECERLRVAHLRAVLARDRANEARGRIRSEWTRRGQALHAAQQAIGDLNARVAELEAAAPPRGWLTAEEREAVEMFIRMGEEHDDVDAECAAMKLRALLARETPPKVKVPNLIQQFTWQSRDSQWIAAIRAAGGEVEG